MRGVFRTSKVNRFVLPYIFMNKIENSTVFTEILSTNTKRAGKS